MRLCRRGQTAPSRKAHIELMEQIQLQRAKSVRYSLSAFTRVFSQATNAKLADPGCPDGVDRLTPNQVKRAAAFAKLFRELSAAELEYYFLVLEEHKAHVLYAEGDAVEEGLAEAAREAVAQTIAPLDAQTLRTLHALKYFPELAREMSGPAQGAAVGQTTAAAERPAETTPEVP